MKQIKTLALLLIAGSVFGQTTKNVLFIGNSYTGVNNLPSLTQSLATSMGDVLNIDSNTPGGTTFTGHTNNATTLNKIGQGTFDYVILQAQSQEPSFPPTQVASDTKPYAEILCDSIISANECAIPLFYMTWGRENGDQNNCQFYPPICTYDGMNARLRESYLEMADENDAEVSPVGAAWKYVRDNYPAYGLYTADGSHPSIYGSYLAACVHYASIYKKSPVGATFTSTLSASDAAIFQNVAEMVVIDSMDVWNFGVRDINTDYSSADGSNLELVFTNESDNSTDYIWDFGDGNTSTAENPSHTYAGPGIFNIELLASNACGSDSIEYAITVTDFAASIEEQSSQVNVKRIEDRINIESTSAEDLTLQIHDITGKLVIKTTISFGSNEFQLPNQKGMYFVNIFTNDTKVISKKVSNL